MAFQEEKKLHQIDVDRPTQAAGTKRQQMLLGTGSASRLQTITPSVKILSSKIGNLNKKGGVQALQAKNEEITETDLVKNATSIQDAFGDSDSDDSLNDDRWSDDDEFMTTQIN